MDGQTITKHYFISGRVQGVGFRAFTRRLATQYRLNGWVRNLVDGRVEALACGPRTEVDRFERALRGGPFPGSVENMQTSDVEDDPKLSGFEIRRDDQP